MDPCLLMTCVLPEPKCIPVFLTMIHTARDLKGRIIKTTEGSDIQDLGQMDLYHRKLKYVHYFLFQSL